MRKYIHIVNRNGSEAFISRLLEEIFGPRIFIIKDLAVGIEKEDRRIIFNDFHFLPSSRHTSIRRMSNNIKKYYYWPCIDKDIKDFVRYCDLCQRQKHSTPINTLSARP